MTSATFEPRFSGNTTAKGIRLINEEGNMMTQKEMVLEAANAFFKTSVTAVFEALDKNLVSARDDATQKKAAIDRARLGLEASQRTHAACMDLANALP